jgi:hypothetical protein
VIAASTDAVAVDTFARYTRPDGVTAVASCDIYEFAGDEITAITLLCRRGRSGRRRFTTATSNVARSPRLLGCRGGKLIASWVDWRRWCAAGLDCFAGG